MEDGYLSDFVQAISLITEKGLHVTVAIATAYTSSWSTVQGWINGGLTEAASHTRTHPCTDAEYQVLGFMSEVVGSRDDLLDALALPNPYSSYPNPGGTPEMLSSLNSTFDNAYAIGGIYQLLDHPWQKRWSTGGYLEQHAEYMANRKDVWYATLGNLYLYHYLQERGKVSVSAQ